MESVDSRDEETPFVAGGDNSSPKTKAHTISDVYVLSTAFLLVFVAYGATQNLESSVNTADNLGTISLGILYVSFTFFSLIASLVVRALGSKNSIILGTTGYWLFIAANLKPTWYTMVPASLFLGFAASIIWVGEGTYLTSAAHSHAKAFHLHEGTVIGSFNGVFWAMFASHQFGGNLISLALLRDDSGGDTSGTTLLFVVFLCITTLGTIITCFLRKIDSMEEKQVQESSISFYSSVVSMSRIVLSPLADIRMILVIPLMAYSGLQQAFVWAEFTKDIVKPALGVSGVAGSMVLYGAFDAICSLTAGRLTSGLKSITWIVSGGLLLQAFIFLWMLIDYRYHGVYKIICPLLQAAILGIGDGVLNTQLNAFLGLLFKSNMEGAFAQLKVWQSAFIAVIFFLSPYITLQAMLGIMLGAICLSVSGFLFLTLHVEKAFTSSNS